MWLAAALGTALCFGINNSLFKWGTTQSLSKVGIQFYFYLIAFALSLSYGLYNHLLHPTLPALAIGAAIGILNTNGNIQMTKAFEKGPVSITSTLIAMNSLIPILLGCLFFPETIAVVQWLGILLMITSAVIVQYQPKKDASQIDYKSWIFRISLALLSAGLVGTLMKWATYEHIRFLDVMVSMYGGGLIYLVILSFKESIGVREAKVGTIVGLISITGYSCYLYALQTGPASIVFSIISLNCIIVMLAGILVFKERLRSFQLLGMLIAFAGIVLTRL